MPDERTGRECWCGNTLDPTSISAVSADCNMPCGGDNTQICGGPARLNLYKSTSLPPPPPLPVLPTTPGQIGDYVYQGW
jgi:WSC domain